MGLSYLYLHFLLETSSFQRPLRSAFVYEQVMDEDGDKTNQRPEQHAQTLHQPDQIHGQHRSPRKTMSVRNVQNVSRFGVDSDGVVEPPRKLRHARPSIGEEILPNDKGKGKLIL